MHKLITCTLAVCLLAGTAVLTPVHGQSPAQKGASTTSEPTEAKKAKPIPFRGKVSAVDKTAMTISLEGKEKPRIIHLTTDTRIMKAGKPATLADAVVGEEVGGQLVKDAEGKQQAVSLRLGEKPEPAPKPAKETKSKKGG